MDIVFDLDGTLFDTLNIHMKSLMEVGNVLCRKISTLHILKYLHGTVNQQLTEIYGDNLYKESAALYYRCFIKLLREGYVQDSICIVEFLNFLIQRSFNIHIFTARDSITSMELLNYFSICDYFKTVTCIDYGEKLTKSNMYDVFERLEQVIYVTDDISEYDFFLKQKIPVVLAGWHYKNKKFPSNIRVCKEVNDLLELSEIKLQMNL